MVPVDINDFNRFLSSTAQVQNTQLDKKAPKEQQTARGFVSQASCCLSNMHTSQPNLPDSPTCSCLNPFLHAKAFCGKTALAGHRW